MPDNSLFKSMTICTNAATFRITGNNINDIYNSYDPIIIPPINPLATDLSIDGNTNYNRGVRRSLLPFLGNALSLLTGTATTRDVNTIKKRVNQLFTA